MECSLGRYNGRNGELFLPPFVLTSFSFRIGLRCETFFPMDASCCVSFVIFQLLLQLVARQLVGDQFRVDQWLANDVLGSGDF